MPNLEFQSLDNVYLELIADDSAIAGDDVTYDDFTYDDVRTNDILIAAPSARRKKAPPPKPPQLQRPPRTPSEAEVNRS